MVGVGVVLHSLSGGQGSLQGLPGCGRVVGLGQFLNLAYFLSQGSLVHIPNDQFDLGQDHRRISRRVSVLGRSTIDICHNDLMLTGTQPGNRNVVSNRGGCRAGAIASSRCGTDQICTVIGGAVHTNHQILAGTVIVGNTADAQGLCINRRHHLIVPGICVVNVAAVNLHIGHLEVSNRGLSLIPHGYRITAIEDNAVEHLFPAVSRLEYQLQGMLAAQAHNPDWDVLVQVSISAVDNIGIPQGLGCGNCLGSRCGIHSRAAVDPVADRTCTASADKPVIQVDIGQSAINGRLTAVDHIIVVFMPAVGQTAQGEGRYDDCPLQTALCCAQGFQCLFHRCLICIVIVHNALGGGLGFHQDCPGSGRIICFHQTGQCCDRLDQAFLIRLGFL